MASKNPQFANDELYHVVLRAVGDTVVFENKDNFYRGIFSIYEFNNDNPVSIRDRREQRKAEKILQKQKESPRGPTSGKLTAEDIGDKRDVFVEVFAFSFMPNHLHLILKQVKDGGTVKFMQKVGTGFAVYFNKKYSRKGHLFNKFKAVHIEDDDQLKNTFVYVHTNLISLVEPCWKERGIVNSEKVKEFLENDKRHSYPDYLGKKNFPSVTQRDFFLDVMGGVEGCKVEVDNWIMHKKEVRDLGKIVLE